MMNIGLDSYEWTWLHLGRYIHGINRPVAVGNRKNNLTGLNYSGENSLASLEGT